MSLPKAQYSQVHKQGPQVDTTLEISLNGRLFWNLSVLENIMVGLSEVRHTSPFAALLPSKAEKEKEQRCIDKAVDIMKNFGTLLTSQANKLSKDLPYADRRRLEICRAIASDPKAILLDEPSLGLAPLVVNDIFSTIKEINKEGTTVLLIEQNGPRLHAPFEH